MANSFNALLDSGCTRHVVRDRALFHDFAEKSVSVGTATYGSLDALGSGDVEFRYPFGDRNVIFTLRDCLYAPTAPVNLLSVGTLVERGMSCLFSPGGITKAFYPENHPKFPGLTISATVVNRLSFLFLDFIPPVASLPVAFSARVSPPVAVPPSHLASLPSSNSPLSFHRKHNSPPKKSKKPLFSNLNYLVVDATLPSHIFSDRSLFTTYIPSRQIHQNVFGTDIIIEGTGDVHVRVIVSGKSLLFRFRDSWHVPSSPYHFFLCSTVVSLGHQIMIAGRSPRMIFSHKRRLVVPDLPKYIPFTRLGALTVLKFEIPSLGSISSQPPSWLIDTQMVAPDIISLHAPAHHHPFAGLASTLSAFDQCPPLQTHQHHEFPFSPNCPLPDDAIAVIENRCAKDMSCANDGLHGGDDGLMTPTDLMTDFLNGDVQIQAANTSQDDSNIRLKANFLEALNSLPAVFNPQVGDNFIAHLCTPSESCSSLSQSFTFISNVNMTPFPYFSHSSFSFTFSPLTLFESSFHTSVQQLFMPFPLKSLSLLHSLYPDIEETDSLIFHTSIFYNRRYSCTCTYNTPLISILNHSSYLSDCFSYHWPTPLFSTFCVSLISFVYLHFKVSRDESRLFAINFSLDSFCESCPVPYYHHILIFSTTLAVSLVTCLTAGVFLQLLLTHCHWSPHADSDSNSFVAPGDWAWDADENAMNWKTGGSVFEAWGQDSWVSQGFDPAFRIHLMLALLGFTINSDATTIIHNHNTTSALIPLSLPPSSPKVLLMSPEIPTQFAMHSTSCQ